MSLYAIQQYYSDVDKLIHFGGSSNETSVRNAFSKLLDLYAHSRDLKLVPEISIKTKEGKTIRPDGILKDTLRLNHGYWESKDGKDDINEEIRKKRNKGYPFDNILFEDSITAILFQNNKEVLRVPMSDGPELDKLLNKFVGFEREEVKEFNKAITLFKQDIPKVTKAIHEIIEAQKNNLEFRESLLGFHLICQQAINSLITLDDIQEMLIQHILSADIFNTIFDEPHFHQENNIARELNKVIDSFFVGSTRRTALNSIKHYYETINATAASIADHHEKQKFLKVVYENFYKAYNPKAADRLGIVYTPNEVVKFMVASTDYLAYKHFGKSLSDQDVDILDPATGTGTFMCDIIDYLKHAGSKKLEFKYKNELHANELAILPYYIANLNIEYTFKQATGKYVEFENLCFVDTLDNTGFDWQGKQGELFALGTENVARIKKQNSRKISIIIGNPPYNANQQNENDKNKNRYYPIIDKRIKDTFIKHSNAQKTKMYDMYSRFYRWAMDRLDEKGIIAFITNRSFIDSKTFDGFRKCIQSDFDHAYIIDTKSDVRNNPKISGTTHNIFGIQTGVAILFLVKNGNQSDKACRINYVAMEDKWRKEEKLQWLSQHTIDTIDFGLITPNKQNDWLNHGSKDWEKLVSVASKDVKAGKSNEAIFSSFSLGVATNRDEWVYDLNETNLAEKIKFFANSYNSEVDRWNSSTRKQKITDFIKRDIKWTTELESYLLRNKKIQFDPKKIRPSAYRCFFKSNLYFDKIVVHRLYQNEQYFGIDKHQKNRVIVVNTNGKEFAVLATDLIPNNHFNGDSQCLPFYTYENGQKRENITDWSLREFQYNYQDSNIHKEDIFHYVYAVLHCPAYRSKYEMDLKKNLPRIPYYNDFKKWRDWGKELMELHINYETLPLYKLKRVESNSIRNPKAKLKAIPSKKQIQVDENTFLLGIPDIVWEYKIGSKSALEWVLDQYKTKKSKDATISQRFDLQKLQHQKDFVISLLARLVTLSLSSVKIIGKMVP